MCHHLNDSTLYLCISGRWHVETKGQLVAIDSLLLSFGSHPSDPTHALQIGGKFLDSYIASPPVLLETGSPTDPEISDSARTVLSVSAFPAWSVY